MQYSFWFGIFFDLYILMYILHTERARVLFCKVSSLYMVKGVFGTSLKVRFQLLCLGRKRLSVACFRRVGSDKVVRNAGRRLGMGTGSC